MFFDIRARISFRSIVSISVIIHQYFKSEKMFNKLFILHV
jgi:hypothetical protein